MLSAFGSCELKFLEMFKMEEKIHGLSYDKLIVLSIADSQEE